jgi:rhodanese-related sulfurtransferase
MLWKQGARAALDLGYTNVRHFKGGLKGWAEENGKFEP